MKELDMQSIELEFKKVRESATTNKCHETRDARSLVVGKAVRQGDIYIHKVNASHPHGPKTDNYQLAFGNTKGSRHIAHGDCITLYEGTKAPSYCESNTFLGQFIEATDDFKILHPEHADFILSAGCYQVTHQMNVLTRKRMKD